MDVRFEKETAWLTQRQMGEVFDTTPENVLMHLKNIYKTGELEQKSTAKDFLVVRTEGKRQAKRKLKHYNLDAVISVGYRVNSKRGVQFRIWTTQRLRDYLIQGYTINQQRFEQNAAELKQALALGYHQICSSLIFFNSVDDIIRNFNERWFQGWSATPQEQRVKFLNIADSIKAHPDFDEKYKNNGDTHNRILAFQKIFEDVMLEKRRNEMELYKLLASDAAFKSAMQQSLREIVDR